MLGTLLATVALTVSAGTAGDVSFALSPQRARVLDGPSASSLLRGVAADGAVGVNAQWERGGGPGMFIEEQRRGAESVFAGLALRRPQLWRAGLRELDWAVAHQGADGGFPATQDAFHSTSFLVEALAHLILVVRHASHLPATLARGVLRLAGPLRRAAAWLGSPAVLAAGLAGDAPYAHRRFLVACALGLARLAGGGRTIGASATRVLGLGLAAQRADGEDPELGGPDDSYQARGLAYAEHLDAWAPAVPGLRRAIARGLRWERRRILPSGEVPEAGNTRANGVMVDHNGPKRVVYPAVAEALLWWGERGGGGPAWTRLALEVAVFGHEHPALVGS